MICCSQPSYFCNIGLKISTDPKIHSQVDICHAFVEKKYILSKVTFTTSSFEINWFSESPQKWPFALIENIFPFRSDCQPNLYLQFVQIDFNISLIFAFSEQIHKFCLIYVQYSRYIQLCKGHCIQLLLLILFFLLFKFLQLGYLLGKRCFGVNFFGLPNNY